MKKFKKILKKYAFEQNYSNMVMEEFESFSMDFLNENQETYLNENSLGQKIVPDDDPIKLYNFWNWFGNSKCVDEKGRPLIVYHMSRNKFDKFDIDKSNGGSWGGGFYFSSDKLGEWMYGETEYSCYLKLDNPCIIDFPKTYGDYVKLCNDILDYHDKDGMENNYDYFLGYPKTQTAVYAFAKIYRELYGDNRPNKIYKDKGFDSVVIKDSIIGSQGDVKIKNEFLVFDPNQIKSVNNKGTFSSTSDNIFESENKVVTTLPNENSLGEKIIPDDDPVKLQNFWNWFGNSKAIKNGKPMIFYHGTPNDFSVFDIKKSSPYGVVGQGFYFSDIYDTAKQYLGGVLNRISSESNIKECYLKMIKPYNLEEEMNNEELSKIRQIILENNNDFWFNKILEGIQYSEKSSPKGWDFDDYINPERINRNDLHDCINWFYKKKVLDNNNFSRFNIWQIITDDFHTISAKRLLMTLMFNNGYDSAIFEIIGDNKGKGSYKNWCYVVFDPNQIKSVNNKGTFLSTSDNIFEALNLEEFPNRKKVTVYHGSSNKNLKIKDDSLIYFTTNKEDAIRWADRFILGGKKNKISYVYTAEITFDKPYVIGDTSVNSEYKKYEDQPEKEKKEIFSEIFYDDLNENRSELVSKGYDCFIDNQISDNITYYIIPSQFMDNIKWLKIEDKDFLNESMLLNEMKMEEAD